ncbi:MAG TPA: glutathione peroxidase [Burkholderiales bacterium]|nr:glutathione peroxidase [Burkholderiales bacterium]
MKANIPTLAVLALALAPAALAAECPPILSHQFNSLQGQSINLCDYSDKTILVVNTASKCGYTPQFEKLEGMYRKYRDKGLLVIGFPSNDFNQELATDKEIAEFCKLTYAVDFPMISKGSVSGDNATPFYQQLKAATGQSPKWNFHKYLIMPGGTQVYSFGTKVEPDSPEILGKITPALR